jgi:tripartite-type tricarboxylate transporter receptor subunit TctC
MLKKLLFVLLTVASLAAHAQWDPTKRNIEIVCPYPPGGASDKVARVIDQIFNEHGWRSVVLNKPGADTVIGANYAAKAAPDGYTFYMGGNGFLDSNIAFKKKAEGIEYTESSFTPVVPMGISTLVLAVPATSPVNSYAELKDYVKKNPKKFNVGFWNSNTANLFTLWAKLEGLPNPTIIPYKGSAPQMADLMGGSLDMAFDTYVSMKQPWQAGKVKIIATMTAEGQVLIHKTEPGFKTTVLSKMHPELNLNIWYGLYAPTGVDPKIISEINRVVNSALVDPKYKEKFASSEIVGPGGTMAELYITQDRALKLLKNVSKNIE